MSDYHSERVLIDLDEVISFHPELCRAFGGIHEALLFQQLYYWRKLGIREDGFIYKTKAEIEKETCIGRYQLDKSRANLERLGVLETRLLRANGSPTLHYRVNVSRANEILMAARATNGKADIDYSEKLKSTKGKAEISDSITKTTTKTTQRDIDTSKAVSGVMPKKSQPKPRPESSTQDHPTPKEPNPVYQLTDYVRTTQGHAEYANPSMHFRHAKTILVTYSLDEAKQAADLMLKDDFWRQKGITTKNLADHIHRFIGQVRANPYVDDRKKCVVDYQFLKRLPREACNEIGQKYNLHWMALEKVCNQIADWMAEHKRTKADIRQWLCDEIEPQADELRQAFGPFMYLMPEPEELQKARGER